MSNEKAQLFVDEARKLVGTKWRHRGRSRFSVDCIGLIVVAGKAAQLLAHDENNYGREPWEDRLRLGCRARWGDPVTDYQPGDIALIRWGKGEPSHMAIIGDKTGGLTIIHAHNLHGVVECTLSGKIAECVVEVYRPRFA